MHVPATKGLPKPLSLLLIAAVIALLLGVSALVRAPSALAATISEDSYGTQQGSQIAAASGPRTVALFQGFNGFTYSGPDGADAGTIAVGLADPDALAAIFAYDPDTDRFNVWRNGPAFLNTLSRLHSNQALFLLLDRPSTWGGPALPYPAQTLPLAQGFNLIPYLGPNGLSPADALAQLPDLAPVTSLFYLDPASQTYRSFRRGAPEILNTLNALPRYAVLWAVTTRPTTWPLEPFVGGPVIDDVLPAVIDPAASRVFMLRGDNFGATPYVTVGGVESEATLISGGNAVQVALPADVAAGATAVDVTSNGLTARTSIMVGTPDLAAVLAALESTKALVSLCTDDEASVSSIQASLDAIIGQLSAGTYTAALDATAEFVNTVAETPALSPVSAQALQELGLSFATGIATLNGVLLPDVGDLLLPDLGDLITTVIGVGLGIGL